ncbi:MAG TPA: biotin transporter BioY [Gemmatimonadota bacterium]|jgi:biotin transport system substrate-specific component
MSTHALDSRARATPLLLRLGLAVGFAAAAAVAAQVRIPLPFTPVPITLQTAVVLAAGPVLGGAWGAAAMGFYLAAGALGAPVFAGFDSGAAELLGATGGYLLAFAVVPPLAARTLPPGAGFARAFLVLLAASGVILLWGAVQLAAVLDLEPGRAFALGVAPFLAGDVLKVGAAAAAFRAAGRWPARLRLRP